MLSHASVIGFAGGPTLRGGKLPSSLLVACISRRRSVIRLGLAASLVSAFYDRHPRYSNYVHANATATSPRINMTSG
jgi:hypothetical protein